MLSLLLIQQSTVGKRVAGEGGGVGLGFETFAYIKPIQLMKIFLYPMQYALSSAILPQMSRWRR